MSQVRSHFRLAVAVVLMLACVRSTEAASHPPDANVLSVRAIGGVVVQYPREWKAAVTKDGAVVAVAGPTRGRVRPAATFFVARGQGDIAEMLDSAAGGLGRQTSITLLGERHLSLSRWARYYVRGEGTAAEYVVVGVAQGNGWIVTMVGVDATSDPLLRVHAEVLQGLLASVVFPTQ